MNFLQALVWRWVHWELVSVVTDWWLLVTGKDTFVLLSSALVVTGNLLASTVAEVHVVGAGEFVLNHLRSPLAGLAWWNMDEVHGVNLLNGAASGLDEEKVDNSGSSQVTSGKDVTVVVADGAGDVWREEGEEEVPSPVGSGSESQSVRAITVWEHLGVDSPNHWSPSRGESDNEETGEDNENGSELLGIIRSLGSWSELLVSDGGEDQEAHGHPERTKDKALAATEMLNEVETEESRSDVDTTENHGGDERVLDTHTGENGGTIVEEVVGTGKLLQHLETHGKSNTVSHTWASEDLVPGVVTLSGDNVLIDLGSLEGNSAVIDWNSVETGHGLKSASVLASADIETWRLWHEDHSDDENDTPEPSDGHWNAVGAGVLAGLGSKVDCRGGEDTDGDEQLVRADDGTTDVLWSRLGHVEWDDDGKGTDTKTGDPSSHGNTNPLSWTDGDLNDNADREDQSPEWNGALASDLVGEWTGAESTNKSTDREKSDDQTRSDVGPVVFAVWLLLSEALLEVVHLEETGNLSSIITEDKTRVVVNTYPHTCKEIVGIAYPPMAAITAMIKVLMVNFGTLLSSRFGFAMIAAMSVLVWSNGMFMPASVCLTEEPEDDTWPSFFDLRKPMLRVSIQCVVENRCCC